MQVYRRLANPAAIVAAARAKMQRGTKRPDTYGPHIPVELRRDFGLADGSLVGNNGQSGGSGLLALTQPVRPSSRDGAEQVIFVNGMRVRPAAFMENMRAVAESADGCVVHGVYNGSRSGGRDVIRGYKDHLRAHENPAVLQLARAFERAIIRKHGLHVIAHSQGAAVTAEALRMARNNVASRFSWAYAQDGLLGLRIETHGAAGCRFIDGPRYVHYINTEDPVPHFSGLAPGLCLSRIHRPGRDAVMRYFSYVAPSHRDPTLFEHWEKLVHSMTIYAKHREPFEVAYARGSSTIDKREIIARLRWAPVRALFDLAMLPASCLSLCRTIFRVLTGRSRAVPARAPAATLSAGR